MKSTSNEDRARHFEAYGSQTGLHPRTSDALMELMYEVSNNLSAEDMNDMPWGKEYLTTLELMHWVASRKAAGATIDIEACELDRWHTEELDVYGVYTRIGSLPDRCSGCISSNYFVRSPASNGWVCIDDLPDTITPDMIRARIDRDWIAYCKANPDDHRVRLARTTGMRIW